MAEVEVALDGGGSVWVSYDPRLVRTAIAALEAHDAAWHLLRRRRANPFASAFDGLNQALRPLSADFDRVSWQVKAYTLSNLRPTPRLVLTAEDDVWTLLAVDDSDEAADREDNSQIETLADADFGQGAAMLQDFLEKATADAKAPRR